MTQHMELAKITRNTMRADGLTVGQALDKDAAFLRSIGIPAKDGALTLYEQREEMIEKFRKAVLDAMDVVAEEVTGDRENGPKDFELRELFRSVDAIADRVFDKTLGF